MKTIPKDFQRFIEIFKTYVDLFDMKAFRIIYEHGGDNADNGGVTPNPIEDRVVTVRLSKEIDDTIEAIAKHEACEMFVSRFAQLADRRFATQEQLDDERHFIVRTLENILP